MQVAEKTVLIAGAQSRLGLSIALKMADNGANVALLDKDEKIISRIAEQIRDQNDVRESHGRAVAIVGDPLNPKSLTEATRKAAETFGSIDILIDNFCYYKRIPATDEAIVTELDTFLSVNLRASILLTEEALKFLKTRRHGRIIYMVPDTARLGITGDGLFAASRTGLIHYAKTLSKELSGPNHISVNCVASGLFEEYLIGRDPKQPSLKEAQQEYTKHIAGARLSDPNEVAEIVLFLASPKANAITGQVIPANHGLSLFG